MRYHLDRIAAAQRAYDLAVDEVARLALELGARRRDWWEAIRLALLDDVRTPR